jgi:hypothetical protein
MMRLLCQVCGGPASRTTDGVLWLLRRPPAPRPSWPDDFATSHPPVCEPCAVAATTQCPHLHGNWAALRVRSPQIWGVHGTLYHPGKHTILQDRITLPYGHPLLAWTLARQVLCTLGNSTLIDLSVTSCRTGRLAATREQRPNALEVQWT